MFDKHGDDAILFFPQSFHFRPHILQGVADPAVTWPVIHIQTLEWKKKKTTTLNWCVILLLPSSTIFTGKLFILLKLLFCLQDRLSSTRQYSILKLYAITNFDHMSLDIHLQYTYFSQNIISFLEFRWNHQSLKCTSF